MPDINEVLYKSYIEHVPSSANDRYIFILKNKNEFDSVIRSGFKAAFFDSTFTVDSFKTITSNCINVSEYVFVLCLNNAESRLLEEYFNTECFYNPMVWPDGWKIFKNKEFLTLPEFDQELHKDIQKYIDRHAGTAAASAEEHAKEKYKSTYRGFRGFREGICRELNKMNGEFEPIEEFAKSEAPDLPEFKTEWFPYPYKEFCEELAKNIGVARDMAGIPIIAAVSACTQKKYSVMVQKDYFEPVNVYMLDIAAPSERKSPVLSKVIAPIIQYQKSLNDEITISNKKRAIKSDELKAQLKRLKKRPDEDEKERILKELEELKPLPKKKLIVDDTTTEALAKCLAENDEKTSIFTAEGGVFSIMAGLYNDGKSNLDLYLKAYSSEYVSIIRVNAPDIELYYPTLTMMLFVQPTVVQKLMKNPEFKGRGLLARFGYIFPKSLVGSRTLSEEGIDQSIADAYSHSINYLLSEVEKDKPKIIKLSTDAYGLMKSYYDEIELQTKEETETVFDEWLGKSFGRCIRIAGILHLMANDQYADSVEINAETAFKAIEIEEYITAHSRYAFTAMGEKNTPSEEDAKYFLKRIEKIILTSLNSPKTPKTPKTDEAGKDAAFMIPFQDFWQAARNTKYDTKEKMTRGLQELVIRKYIRIKRTDPGESGGRPAEYIEVNPQLLK